MLPNAADAGMTNKPLERVLHVRIEQPRASWREEQGRDVRRLARTIGAAEIVAKGGDRGHSNIRGVIGNGSMDIAVTSEQDG